jgi:hypothetical protein
MPRLTYREVIPLCSEDMQIRLSELKGSETSTSKRQRYNLLIQSDFDDSDGNIT